MDKSRLKVLREEILEKVGEYERERRGTVAPFAPGDIVPYGGRNYGEEEVQAGVASMLDFWLTLGPEGDAFQRELADYLGVASSVLVNSGSSANLLAIASLTSHKLGERRLRPGDEVITAAAGFPTTVTPIVQVGAVPVFIDVDPITANPRVDQLESAWKPGVTKAVFFAHTLGNPFDIGEVSRFCREKGIWMLEDNCDALGSTWNGRLTGSFGDISTQSFYPPHHITMGEGGAVNVVSDRSLKRLVESFRDWGRDCWCPSGLDNSCARRFAWKMGELPEGYDHKYVYSHLGYNLKPTDPQAAIGRVQLRRAAGFHAARAANWQYLRTRLANLEDRIEFQLPTGASSWTSDGFGWKGTDRAAPSWFGFMMLARPGVCRNDMARGLDREKIGNRMLFGGNLVRQPAFVQLAQDTGGRGWRAPVPLDGADRIMRDAVFVGVYPGLEEEHLEYMSKTIHRILENASV